MLIEYTKKPQWDVDLHETIYSHLRRAWRLRNVAPDEAQWHLNEAVATLYVADCPSEQDEIGKEPIQ